MRLLCYWEARNVQRGEELMGVDMLLLNYQVCSVPPLEFIYIFNVSVVFNPYKV